MRQNLLHDLEAIGFYGVDPNGATRLSGYTHRLLHIYVQEKLVKDIHQEVKLPLDTCRPHGNEKYTIIINLSGRHWMSLPKFSGPASPYASATMETQ